MALLETECEERAETLLMLCFVFTRLGLPFPGVFSVFVWVCSLGQSITTLLAEGTEFYSALKFVAKMGLFFHLFRCCVTCTAAVLRAYSARQHKSPLFSNGLST